jgi:hypothetical protein
MSKLIEYRERLATVFGRLEELQKADKRSDADESEIDQLLKEAERSRPEDDP